MIISWLGVLSSYFILRFFTHLSLNQPPRRTTHGTSAIPSPPSLSASTASALRNITSLLLHAPADKHFMFHPKGESFVKHTRTLMEGGFCPKSIESSANDWREAGEWFEVLLMKED